MIIEESIHSTPTKPRLLFIETGDSEKELLKALGPISTAITGVLYECSLTNKYYILLEAVVK